MRFTIIMIAAVLGLGVLAGCGEEDADTAAGDGQAQATPEAGQGAGQEASAQDTVDLAQLLEDPSQFAGQEITVSGDVEGATGAPTAFDLTPAQGEEAIVVLPTSAAGDVAGIASAERVTVTGTVMEVTDTLADQAEFLFEGNEQAPEDVLSRIDGDYILAADQVSEAG